MAGPVPVRSFRLAGIVPGCPQPARSVSVRPAHGSVRGRRACERPQSQDRWRVGQPRLL